MVLQIVGWYGALAIVVAYALNTFEVLGPKSFWYQMLNATGALGILLVALGHTDYPPAALNSFWLLIAIIALTRIILNKRRS